MLVREMLAFKSVMVCPISVAGEKASCLLCSN